ncbi:MAG: hypothetical protein R3B47_05475 [Bacteroidia bacterium]
MKVLATATLFFSFLQFYAQNSSFDSMLVEVKQNHQIWAGSSWENWNRDSLEKNFAQSLEKLLASAEFCNVPFPDSLPAPFWNAEHIDDYEAPARFYMLFSYISYCQSADCKLAIFSWDNRGGGSYHSFSNYLWHRKDSNQCAVMFLPDFNMPGIPQRDSDPAAAADASFYAIDQIERNNTKLYILSGYGTFGSGKHHRSVRIFEEAENGLSECFECYPDREPIDIHCNRSQDVELTFDQKSQTLRWKQFDFDDDMGFFTDSFEWKSWVIP